MAARHTAISGILILGAAALLLAILFGAKISHKMPDFAVYWTAASRARAAEPLYRAEDGHYQFKYLPVFAILAAPMARVSLETAKALWYAASVVLMAALIALSLALLPHRRKSAATLIVCTTFVMLKFYGHELVLGQMNLLFAVVVTAAVVSMRRGHEAVAGALIVCGVVVKPYAVIFLPWLLARRQRGSILAGTIGLLAIALLPACVYGAHGDMQLHHAWWRTVTDSTAPNLTNADNVSIAAMWAKWMGIGSLSTALALGTSIVIVLAAILAFMQRRRLSFAEGLEAALLLTCIPLLSPQGWDYVFLISTPAIMFIVNYERLLPSMLRVGAIAALATIGLSVYDVIGRVAYSVFMSLSLITVCYLIVVAALCRIRALGIA